MSLIGCLTLIIGVRWASLTVTGLTDTDRTAAPPPLWHWHPVAGAWMTEPLTTRTTVVLPVCLLKHLLTPMTGLKRSTITKFHHLF